MKRILLPLLSVALFLFSQLSLSAQNHCLDFDGVDDYVQLPNFQLEDIFTIEFRFRAGKTALVPFEERLISFGPSMRLEIGLMELEAGTFVWFFDQRNGGYFADFGQSVRDNQWHHVAVIYDGSNIRVSVDEDISDPIHYTAPPVPYGSSMRLGAWTGSLGTQTFYSGSLDEVRIWDYARSFDQTLDGRTCQIDGNEEGILAYWNFNQGTPGGNNADAPVLLENSGAELEGDLEGFALSGGSSNWLLSGFADVSCGFVSTEDVNPGTSPLIVSPNPTSGFIALSGMDAGLHEVQIFNIAGVMLKSQRLSNGDAIDLTPFPNGLYLIKAEGKSVIRVIKQ